MTELATAYISIVAETSGIPRSVRAALNQAGGDADRAGRQMGNRMSGALGTAFKAGTAAVVAAGATAATTAGAAMGVALKKGFDRLTAIDDAKGKLAGLGTSAQGTAKIMDSALASVKGTAFGLGDAATIAANAVAAGIKPGQDLTKYLSMTADAASIAGVSLGDMGQILNQVQTGQTAYTDDLNQLADRGIPIYQWLGKEMGVASSEVKGLAADGKISSEVLFRAIQTNIGGAALASGRTVRGAFDNVMAAMGRLGAAAEAPTFARLPGWFSTLTARIDAATPSVKRMAEELDSKVFLDWGPRAGNAIDQAREAYERFSQTALVQDSKDSIEGVFRTLLDAGRQAGPAIADIASSLAQASAALGVSGWQMFLVALQAAGTAASAIAPILTTIGDLMQANQGAVTALAAAFLLFKTIPGLLTPLRLGLAGVSTTAETATTRTAGLASVMNRAGIAAGGMRTAVGTMASTARAAGTELRTLAAANNAQTQIANYGTTTMGRFGSAIARVGESAPLVARMQGSFLNAAGGAERFGRTAGIAAAAGSGLRAAGSGIAGVFGGPLGLALTGAVVAGTAWASSVQNQKSITDAYRASLNELAEEQKNTNALLTESRGSTNSQVYASLTKQVDAYRSSVDSAAKADAKWTDVTADVIEDTFSIFTGGSDNTSQKLDAAAQSAQAARAAVNDLGLTSEQIGMKVSGSNEAWVTFKSTLMGMGAGGQAAAEQLQKLRETFTTQQEAARRLTPGVTELQTAMQKLGDSTATTAEKSNALKTALDALNPARGKQEAMSQQNAVNQQIAKSAQEAADATQGFGRALLANDGSVATTTANGQDLYKALDSIVTAYSSVASAGGDVNAANAANQTSFAQLARKYGVSIDEIRRAANTLGYSDIQLVVSLAGGQDTTQQLGAVADAFSKIPTGQPKVVEVQTGQLTQQTRDALAGLGFQFAEIDRNGVKTVQIKANDTASAALAGVVQQMIATGQMSSFPKVKLDDSAFYLQSQTARDQLRDLGVQVADPKAQLTIDNLLQGKTVSMQALQELDGTIADPQVKMQVDQILRDLGIVDRGLNDTSRPRTATITVKTIEEQTAYGNRVLELLRSSTPQPNANGSVRAFAGGGFTALPDSAVIQKPIPGLVQWAEPETKGEAFIPLAESKRTRSQSILATVADMFGFALLPKGNIPDTLSGQIGGVAGGAISQALARQYSGKLARFADGGIVTARQLRDFVGGAGASRPLTGAPYVWGGINWGDCSGAMAAIARFAAGLPPFGGRFSTANEGEALAALGAKSGTGGPGTLRFGWINNPGGPGGGHTAGTLPDGTNVEMGGSYGGGMVGGSVGANDAQFTNHAYMEVAGGSDALGGAGSASGSSSSASGSSIDQSQLASAYTFDPITTDAASSGGSGDTSLSGRAGSVVGSFITGQLKDFFNVLSVNDQPGWLSALTEYERQHSADGKKNYDALKKQLDADYADGEKQRQTDYDDAKAAIDNDFQAQLISAAERDRRQMALKSQFEADELEHRHDYESNVTATGRKYGQVDDGSARSLSIKQRYEDDQLARTQQLSADQYGRDAQYAREKRALDDLRDGNAISVDEYQRRLSALKAKYDADVRDMKAQFSADQNSLRSRFQMGQAQFDPSQRYIPNTVTTSRITPSDPGTSSAGAAGDPNTGGNGGKSASKASIKDAFKQGLRPAWRFGESWTDTDWLINKESTWEPGARNGKFFGLGQWSPEAWAAAGKTETEDPTTQGQVHDSYVGGRYQTPRSARDFWQKNNYYDQGGEASGIGVMFKNVLRPERVLSPDETAAFQDGARTGFAGGTDLLAGKLDQLITLFTAAPPRGTVQYNLRDERGLRLAENAENRRVSTALAGR